MQFLCFNKIYTQLINDGILNEKGISLSVLRIDEIHPVVSGNKWFKLKYYLEDAVNKKCDTIATFGGAYSNHIVASAFACKELGMKSVGIIRGEEPKTWSPTLQQAKQAGMEFFFLSRTNFKNKQFIKEKFTKPCWYWVNEGGYGITGARGASEISEWIDESYTHIVCATGTGTMMAGLIKAAKPHQTVIGINVLKNEALINEIKELLTEGEKLKKFHLINDYHFGGYAKHPLQLTNFMKTMWHQHQLPTDIVYTSKMMFGVLNLAEMGFFEYGSKVIAIHSGGLQGNLSLPLNSLPF
jgi:1-aminocyclopropane-1-carboxylate deaminase